MFVGRLIQMWMSYEHQYPTIGNKCQATIIINEGVFGVVSMRLSILMEDILSNIKLCYA